MPLLSKLGPSLEEGHPSFTEKTPVRLLRGRAKHRRRGLLHGRPEEVPHLVDRVLFDDSLPFGLPDDLHLLVECLEKLIPSLSKPEGSHRAISVELGYCSRCRVKQIDLEFDVEGGMVL